MILIIGVQLTPYSNFGSTDCLRKKNRKANTIHQTKKNDDGRAEHLMVKGMGLFLNQEYEKALHKFTSLIHENDQYAAAHFMIARCHQISGETNLLIQYAKAAFEIDPENNSYKELLLEGHKKNQDLLAITELYEKLIDNKTANRNDHLRLAEAYYERATRASEDLLLLEQGSKKYNNRQEEITLHCGNTILTYDRMREIYGPNKDVSKTVVHLYTHFGQHDKAYSESLSNIKSFNNDPKLIYEHCQRFYKKFPAQTLEYLQESINRHPTDVSLKLLAHDFYTIEGNESYAKIMLQEAFDNDLLTLTQRIQIIRSYTNDLDPEQLLIAKELAQITLKYHPQEALSYFMLGDVQLTLQNTEQAVKNYMKGLELDQSKTSYWEQSLQILTRTGAYNQVIETGDKCLKYDSTTSSIYWYVGVAHQLNKNYSKAREYLEKGLALAIDPPARFQFNTQLGDIYNELELYNKSDSTFEAALLYDPNNDHCLNNYSYYLSLRGEKLLEAEAMCKRLMRIRPNTPNYIDTYAWVLYRLEKYNDAKNLFEQALKNSSDATIWEHYGMTLMQLNLHKEAIEAFKLAIKNGGNEKDIQPLIDSLNE